MSKRMDGQATVRMDPALKEAMVHCAKQMGVKQNDFIVEAIQRHVLLVTAQRTDETMAPLIAQIVHDSQRQHNAGLRTLIVKVGLEVARMEYALFHFMNHAGVSWGQLSGWREDGWKAAVKEFKQPTPDADATEERK